ncbi:hypothetical protein BKA70DRAFT_1283180 [Coprinopsis sp. MPI-PUGE-AT-0042]|nr:hypothetical protein BKA70DRAFT_1283180 [Coprinopsis sp. MPI-PUGE-AT-0042]
MGSTDLCLELRPRFKRRYEHLFTDEWSAFVPASFLVDQYSDGKIDPAEKWAYDLTVKHFPRVSIPKGLHLVRGYAFQPPRFVYGWGMDNFTIHRIALRCGLEKAIIPLTKKEEQMNPRPAPIVEADVAALLLNAILRERFPDIMARIKWVTFESVTGGGEMFGSCLALADSYETGNQRPPRADVEVLREYFGIGTEGLSAYEENRTLWWVDSMHPLWQWAHSEFYRLDTGWKVLK